jgi:hypothetical protein
MNISRSWATPAALALFSLSAATGLLMFFKIAAPLQKGIHEWIGFGVILTIALHAIANVGAFKNHFFSKKGAILAGSFVLLIGGTSVFRGKDAGKFRANVASKAVSQAPLERVAPLTKRSVDDIVRDLNAAGYAASAEGTIAALSGGNPEKEQAVLAIVFR